MTDVLRSSINATLLILAVVALIVPSLFDVAIQDNLAAEVGLSVSVAVVMIVLYGFTSAKAGETN